MALTKQQKGLISEQYFLIWAYRAGFGEIARPLEGNLPYDFIFRHGGEWFTVQVKSTYFELNGEKRPRHVASLRRSATAANGGTKLAYKDGDFDFLFVHDAHSGCFFWIPWNDIRDLKSRLDVKSKRAQKYLIPLKAE